MGYTTDFEGSLSLTPNLNEKQTKYMNLISSTRRMKRNVNKLMEIYKGKHGNPFPKNKTPEAIYGHDGEFFARDDGECGQSQDASIVDFNCAPGHKGFAQGAVDKGQPGLWCQWDVSEDGDILEWSGGEKFYNYIEWLRYIIKNFFIPWGIVGEGEILWFGEDRSDMGKITVKNNEVFVFTGEVTFEKKG